MKLVTLRELIILEKQREETARLIGALDSSCDMSVNVQDRSLDDRICDAVRPTVLNALIEREAFIREKMEALGVEFAP